MMLEDLPAREMLDLIKFLQIPTHMLQLCLAAQRLETVIEVLDDARMLDADDSDEGHVMSRGRC